MEYTVWTKTEFEPWIPTDCGDLAAAKRVILESVAKGAEVKLCQDIPYKVDIKLEEVKPHEPKKGGPKVDKDPGAESEGGV